MIGMFKESVLKTETSGGVIEFCPVAWHSSNLTLKAYLVMFFLKEYYPALIYICFSLLLASVIFGASYTLAMSEADSEKLSSYECGFDPYEDARNASDVQYVFIL